MTTTLVFASVLIAPCLACSFIVSNFDLSTAEGINLTHVNYHLKFRGPDVTNVHTHAGWTFVHNLLSMTGSSWTLQPFVSDDNSAVALFNGEVYNYQELAEGKKSQGGLEMEWNDSQSDGVILIPAYNQWGTRFVKHFRGEFAIVLVDFAKNIILLSTDVFSTKPLWYGVWPCNTKFSSDMKGNSDQYASTTCFVAASYESALTRMGLPKKYRAMAEPNEVLVLDISNHFSLVSQNRVFEFDLRQHKTSTEDWQRAFIDAVRLRTKCIKHQLFVGMSAGYDSGAIMLALQILKKPFLAYHVGTKKDSIDVIYKRMHYCTNANATVIKLDNDNFQKQRHWLKNRIEPYNYVGADKSWSDHGKLVVDDNASIGLSCILSRVTQQGGYIYLSGSGADETISDYAINGRRVFQHSCFGGRFPANLSDIFPWCSFYKGTQRAYLMKEELTGGAHGIESRYPFLDPLVVQEYLWLAPGVKNSEYKRPIADFFRRFKFPNQFGEKAGFGVVHNQTELSDFFYERDRNGSSRLPPVDDLAGREVGYDTNTKLHSVIPSMLSTMAMYGLMMQRWRYREKEKHATSISI
mmetsp:Transcript_6812/g.19044  ORF Transcript_6812/g.19044 Transcript_6812/m.19044 type:complete len:579 (+) Transcript_6812:61-1797(+)